MKRIPRRIRFGLLLLLLVLSGWSWLAHQHQPIARFALPNGRELRLEYVTYGTEHRIPGAGSLAPAKAWLAEFLSKYRLRRDTGSRYAVEYTYDSTEPCPVLWFTIYDPKTREIDYQLLSSNIIRVEVVHSPAVSTRVQSLLHNEKPLPNAAYPVKNYDRRQASLHLRLTVGSPAGSPAWKASYDLDLANPAVGTAFPEWQPDALPQTRRVAGLDLVLHALWTGTTSDGNVCVAPDFEVLRAGQNGPGYRPDEIEGLIVKYELSDATGNESEFKSIDRDIIRLLRLKTNQGEAAPLPFSEPAWKVRAKVMRDADYAFAPDEGWTLSPVDMPAPGEVRFFAVPDLERKRGLHAVALLGAGDVVWKDGILTATTPATKSIRDLSSDYPRVIFFVPPLDLEAPTTPWNFIYNEFFQRLPPTVAWKHAREGTMDDHLVVRLHQKGAAYGMRERWACEVSPSPGRREVAHIYELRDWGEWRLPAAGTPVSVQIVPKAFSTVEFLVAPPSFPQPKAPERGAAILPN